MEDVKRIASHSTALVRAGLGEFASSDFSSTRTSQLSTGNAVERRFDPALRLNLEDAGDLTAAEGDTSRVPRADLPNRRVVVSQTDYDRFRHRYKREMNRVVSFAGVDHDFFTAAKADELVRLAKRHLGDLRTVNALDVGCGIGLTERFLHGRLERVTGVDVVPGVLDLARETNPWAWYELYDGIRLPFDDESFGLAFAICVVQEVPKAQRAALMTELARVVRRDGLVVVFEHNPLNPLTQLVARRCTFGNNAEMLRMGTLRRLFEQSGLAVRDARFLLVFPKRSRRLLALERYLDRLPLGTQYYIAGSPA